ncbi:MAG TPA: DUF4864 domain-containing protein [Noviherbaspirillum sp.]|nr:DUF4864 domain-containing protein [Noviherbaspirillum sp.]
MNRAILLFCLLFASNCFAAPLEEKDEEAISSTIGILFNSFQNGDTEVAYSLNTEDTRETFGSVGNYLATIKEHYQPIYQHDAAMVVDMSDVKDAVAVTVLIVDNYGAQWMAVFLMKQQEQLWQIESCFLNPAAILDNNVI